MKYTVAVLGLLALCYLVWGSLNLEAARGLPEGVIEGCQDKPSRPLSIRLRTV